MKFVEKAHVEGLGWVEDGDLLLFRHTKTLMSRIIAAAGRGPWSHAGIAAWWGVRWRAGDSKLIPLCIEAREFRGVRAVSVKNQILKGHHIDVFRPDRSKWPKFDAGDTVRHILSRTGSPYNYGGLWAAAKLHLPFFQLWNSPSMDDSGETKSLFCSQAVSEAYRAGGVDPVKNLGDKFTEPCDLARSEFFNYQFTLVK